MNLRRQLLLVFSIILLITLLVGYSGYVSINANEKEVLKLSEEMNYIGTSRELRSSLASLHDKIVDFTLTNNFQQVEREIDILEDLLRKLDEFPKEQSKIRQVLHHLSVEEIAFYLAEIEDLTKEVNDFFEIKNQMLAQSLSGAASSLSSSSGNNEVRMEQELRRMETLKVSILKSLDKLIEIGNDDIDIRVTNMQSSTHANKIRILIILAVAILLGTIIPITMGNKIADPIIKLSDLVKKMGNHDLTKGIEKEPGLSTEVEVIFEEVENMRQNFIHLIRDITIASDDIHTSSAGLQSNSNTLATSSEGIKYAVEEIANNAIEQADNTQDFAHYFENMNLNIEKETAMMENLEDSNNSIEGVINGSTLLVTDLEKASEDTSNQVDEIKEVLTKTNQSISMVDQFITTINAISEQTNLLALNASIEAARAGDAGRGFSVVAEEIRVLADNSKEALEEITSIISQITGDNDEVMSKIESLDQVDQKQSLVVREIVDSFNKINEERVNLSRISSTLKEITDETARGSSALVSNVNNLTNISQENAAGTEEITSLVSEQNDLIENMHQSSSSLADLAAEMKESISKFRT